MTLNPIMTRSTTPPTKGSQFVINELQARAIFRYVEGESFGVASSARHLFESVIGSIETGSRLDWTDPVSTFRMAYSFKTIDVST